MHYPSKRSCIPFLLSAWEWGWRFISKRHYILFTMSVRNWGWCLKLLSLAILNRLPQYLTWYQWGGVFNMFLNTSLQQRCNHMRFEVTPDKKFTRPLTWRTGFAISYHDYRSDQTISMTVLWKVWVFAILKPPESLKYIVMKLI